MHERRVHATRELGPEITVVGAVDPELGHARGVSVTRHRLDEARLAANVVVALRAASAREVDHAAQPREVLRGRGHGAEPAGRLAREHDAVCIRPRLAAHGVDGGAQVARGFQPCGVVVGVGAAAVASAHHPRSRRAAARRTSTAKPIATKLVSATRRSRHRAAPRPGGLPCERPRSGSPPRGLEHGHVDERMPRPGRPGRG